MASRSRNTIAGAERMRTIRMACGRRPPNPKTDKSQYQSVQSLPLIQSKSTHSPHKAKSIRLGCLSSPKTETEVWLSILHPDRELPPRTARAILGLTFPKDDLTRMHELSSNARTGTLTPEEDAEMDNFERVGSVLSTLKSKARQVLKRSSGGV